MPNPSTLTLAQYQDFMLRWQHVYPSARLSGKDGLCAVMQQLAGYGTYPLLWQRDILPARVTRYVPSWLYGWLAEGALVFGRFCLMGEPNYAPGGGTVFCTPESLSYLLAPHEPPDYGWAAHWHAPLRDLQQDCVTVYEIIARHDGIALADIVTATDLPYPRVEKAAWQLYCGGSITNTSAGCLLDSSCVSFLTARSKLPATYGLAAEVGEWVSCVRLRDRYGVAALSDEERFRRQVLQALRLYGIASPQLLAQHFAGLFAQVKNGMPPSEETIRTVCERLTGEEAVVCGAFVAGLRGEQYAVSAALELACMPARKSDDPMVMVSSLDPASLHLTLFPVPSLNAYAFSTRFLVYEHGTLIAAIEQQACAGTTFIVKDIHLLCELDSAHTQRLLAAILDFAQRSGYFDEVEIRGFGHEPVQETSLGFYLLDLGFAATRHGVKLPCRSRAIALDLPGGSADVAEPFDPRLDLIQAACERTVGAGIIRQRNRGRSVLKYKGRLFLECRDGKDPLLLFVSVTRELSELFAAIPAAFRPNARLRQDKYAWIVEVTLPASVDFESEDFAQLTTIWLEYLQRLRQANRKT